MASSSPNTGAAPELDELIGFLSDSRPQVSGQAAQLIAGLTGEDEGLAHLVSRSATAVPPLVGVVESGAARARLAALSALVNLTQEPDAAQAALRAGADAAARGVLEAALAAHAPGEAERARGEAEAEAEARAHAVDAQSLGWESHYASASGRGEDGGAGSLGAASAGATPQSTHLALMLLVNLTAAPEGSVQTLGSHVGTAERAARTAALARVCCGALEAGLAAGESTSAARAAPASVPSPASLVLALLVNLTTAGAGRRMVSGSPALLASVLQFLGPSAPGPMRRSASSLLKNVCLTCGDDESALALAEAPGLLRRVLDCLCGAARGGEEGRLEDGLASEAGATASLSQTDPDADPVVREALADAVLSLAREDVARQALWAADAPGALQRGYAFEEHPGVCAAMESAAAIFLQQGMGSGGQCGEDEAREKEAPEVQFEEILD